MNPNQKTLLKISLIISLIGILTLLFLANIQEPKLISIDKITDKQLNKNIKVQGQITNIKTYKDSNFQVISIKDGTGKIDITTNQILNLTNSQNLIVIGKLTEYKNNLQIQANKISIS